MNRGSITLSSALVLVFTLTLAAQFNSNLRGVITDPSGGAVPNAKVDVKNSETGVTASTTSDTGGSYVFTSLAPGQYELTVRASGFRTATIRATLQTAQTRDVPVKLALLSASESVEVQAEAPLLDTADARIHATLQTHALESLPLQGRTMFGLITTAPGVTGLGLLTGGAPQSAPDNYSTEITDNVNANGRSFDANLYVVDGLDITSSVRPGVLNLSPSPDSVQEISIQTNTYSVEYGRASSVLTTVTTKSGTNAFHGALSMYYTSQQLWTRTIFTKTYLPFHASNYAAAVGGPIIKNRLFFFGSFEPLRSLVSSSGSTTFEAPQFVSWAQANFPKSIGTGLLTSYPVTGASITGVAKTAQDIFGSGCGTPANANIPCSLPVIDNGVFNYAPFRNGTQVNGRLDAYFHSDRIYGSYYQSVLGTLNPSVRFAMTSTNHNISRTFQLNETHTFSPTMLNEAAFGYLQLEGINNQAGFFHVPYVSIVGQSTTFGINQPHLDFVQHNYHWRDVFDIIHHGHTLKFGVDGFEGDELTLFGQVYNHPVFSFNNLLAFVQDQPFTETGFVYNPLTGQPAFFNLGVANTTFGLFAQDEWRVTPHLTLTLGLRFDNYGNTHASDALKSIISNYYLGQGTTLAGQVASGQLKQTHEILSRTPTTWSPRFGVAWDPTGKGQWTVRGGFGVYHDWITNGELSVPLRFNPPPYAQPTFRVGTTTAPIFSLGASDTFPFGFTVPTLPASSLDSHGGVVGYQLAIGATDPNLKEPVIYNYSIGVQRQIGSHFVVSGNYTGSQGRDLLAGNVNTLSANTDVNRFAGDLIVNKNALHRLIQSFGAINYTFNGNQTSFNAFIATVTGRFGSRDTFQASYTHSRAYDYGTTYPDITNIHQYWGPTDFSVPNRFTLTESMGLPALKNMHPVLRGIAGDWTLSGTVMVESGFPFTVFASAPFSPVLDAGGNVTGFKTGSGDYNADGYNYDFPNIPSSGYSQPGGRQSFLNGLFPASAFGVPTLGSEGGEQRNRFRGPGYANWDLGVLKNFRVKERVGLQLRFEFFNVLNHPNLSAVVSDLSNASFAKSTGTFNPRYLQLGAKIDF